MNDIAEHEPVWDWHYPSKWPTCEVCGVKWPDESVPHHAEKEELIIPDMDESQ